MVGEGNEDDDAAPAFMFLIGWSGLMFCPGSGYLYAHHPWGFWRGAMIRFAGSSAIVLSIAVSWDDPDSKSGWGLFLGGLGIILGSAIYDITKVDNCAEKYNQKYTRSGIRISPHYFAKHKAPGIKLSINF